MEAEIKRFLKATDLKEGHPTEAERQIPPPPPEAPVPQDARVLRLPEPGLLPDKEVNFLELVEMRASIREYSDKELTLQELSFLLWCTQGVKMATENGGTMRTVPSAGARHAFETYLLDYRRMNHRYGPRSARYIFLDAGHVCQNLYLSAYTHQIGVCAIGAFNDDALNAALGLDGENDFAVYGATVGKYLQ
jgi:hypothetical protein